MQVSELKDALAAFNPTAVIVVSIPSLGKPHEARGIHLVGHIDHPGEVKDDHTTHALDLVCDHWDDPKGAHDVTVGHLAGMVAPFPDPMHVRVAVPVAHDSVSHRMLDIVMIGRAVGSGPGIQIVCENWDSPYQVVKSL